VKGDGFSDREVYFFLRAFAFAFFAFFAFLAIAALFQVAGRAAPDLKGTCVRFGLLCHTMFTGKNGPPRSIHKEGSSKAVRRPAGI
jgi:hypothetical protein